MLIQQGLAVVQGLVVAVCCIVGVLVDWLIQSGMMAVVLPDWLVQYDGYGSSMMAVVPVQWRWFQYDGCGSSTMAVVPV